MKKSIRKRIETKCVVIGGSAGSTEVLQVIYKRLLTDLPWPVVICQHVHPHLRRSAFINLGFTGTHPVKEAEEKEQLQAGITYLAPPNYHLLLEQDGTLALNIDEPVCYARPSIDVLFETAARSYTSSLIGVLLTGANADGAAGMARIQERGGLTLVQDPDTADSPTMPKSALNLIEPTACLPPAEIADYLNQLIEGNHER